MQDLLIILYYMTTQCVASIIVLYSKGNYSLLLNGNMIPVDMLIHVYARVYH